MVTRRQGREWALQMLVQFDLNPPAAIDTAISDFWDMQARLEADGLAERKRGIRMLFTSTNPKELAALATMRAFTEVRVKGVWTEIDSVDAMLDPFLSSWPLYRLGTVERSVLRLAAWELKNCTDIPTPIIINEAVDLAKWFSESKSGRFVNGVLDRLGKKMRNAPEKACSPD